jgi:hypothetical protein
MPMATNRATVAKLMLMACVAIVLVVQNVTVVLKASAGQKIQFSSFAMTCPAESGRMCVLCRTNPNAMQKKSKSMGFRTAMRMSVIVFSFL